MNNNCRAEGAVRSRHAVLATQPYVDLEDPASYEPSNREALR